MIHVHDIFEEKTYGTMVYQEQVMQISEDVWFYCGRN